MLLKTREMHEYVPLLLGSLTTPIRVSQTMNRLDDNMVYSISFDREGPTADFLHQRYAIVGRQGRTRRRRPSQQARQNARETALARNALARAQAQADAVNARGELRNTRLYEALQTSTGRQLPDRPQEWWDWWKQENDLYIPQNKPQIDSYDQSVRMLVQCECFLPGTLVWTDIGLRPIEQLQAGDRVLTCNPQTGVISHQSVMTTTVRPAEETTRLRLPGEDIVSTNGHPVWVIGKGWQMAKNVKAGDKLHGIRGVVEVEAVEPGPGSEVYNLIVDGVHNYFVGRRGVLAHDNTMRRPTPCDVPGHLAKSPIAKR